MPPASAIYMNYCRKLRFDERPDYGYLKNLFKDLFQKSAFELDHKYDWVVDKKEQERQEAQVAAILPADKNIPFL